MDPKRMTSNRPAGRLLAPALLLVLACGGCGARAAGSGAPNVPHIALRDVDGRNHYLSDYIGQGVTVMSFWATWCLPCRQELDVLQKLYARHQGEGLRVLAIAVDGPESVARVRPFAKQSGWQFPVLVDRDTRVARLYNPQKKMPMLRIFDRDGRIVYTHTTFQPGEADALRRRVLSVLRGERVAAAGAVSAPTAARRAGCRGGWR